MSNLYKKAGLLLLSMLALFAPKAAAEVIDLGELKVDVDYTLPSFKAVVGKFVVPATANYTVSFQNNGNHVSPYLNYDAATTTPSDLVTTTETTGSGRENYSFDAEANTTVYFYSSFVMNAGTMRISNSSSIEKKLEIVDANPAIGGIYSVTNGYDGPEIQFNMPIQIGVATISCGGKTEAVVGNVTNTPYWNGCTFNLKEKIYGWYDDGSVSGGEKITLTVKDVKSEDGTVIYGTDGSLILEYTLASKPITLKGPKTISTPFLSYYTSGDPAGRLMFEFTGDISGVDAVTMGYGNTEAENEYYTENLPWRVLGNYLVVDLSGKLRSREAMLPGVTTQYSTVLLKLIQVTDTEGNPVYADGSGAIGTFSYILDYQEITADVAAQFSPESGASIDNVDNIEIVISDESSLVYDGVKFSYTENGSNVDYVSTDFTKETDNDGFTTLTVAIPAAVRGKGEITVTLNNLECKSGKDYSADLTATYTSNQGVDYAFASLTYVNAGQAAASLLGDNVSANSFNDGTVINATFTPASGYEYVIFTLNDKTAGEWLYGSSFSKATSVDETSQEAVWDGTWTYTWPTSTTFYEGHEYELVVQLQTGEVYNPTTLATLTATWEGATAAYKYSPLTLVSATPANGEEITTIAPISIDLTFSGKVKLINPSYPLGMGAGTAPLDYSNAESAEYSTNWSITATKDALETGYITFGVEDENGLRLNSGDNYEANSLFSLTYTYTAENPKPVVVPGEGVVTSLKEFTISSPTEDQINFSYNTSDPIYLIYDGRSIVAQITDEDMVQSDDYKSYTFSLPEEITEPGEYKLVIPAMFFNFGEELSSVNSGALTVYYTIQGEKPGLDVVTDPANGSTVSELSEILVTFTNNQTAGWTDMEKMDVEILKDNVVVANPTKDYGMDWNALKLILSTPLTEEGTYTLRIPEGSYNLDDDYDAVFPEITFTYIISLGGIDTVTFDNITEVTVYNLQGMLVRKGYGPDTLIGLNGLYIVNGHKVMLRN